MEGTQSVIVGAKILLVFIVCGVMVGVVAAKNSDQYYPTSEYTEIFEGPLLKEYERTTDAFFGLFRTSYKIHGTESKLVWKETYENSEYYDYFLEINITKEERFILFLPNKDYTIDLGPLGYGNFEQWLEEEDGPFLCLEEPSTKFFQDTYELKRDGKEILNDPMNPSFLETITVSLLVKQEED